MNVNIRVAVGDNTVDEATAARFLQEFILDKFSFVTSVTPLRSGFAGHLVPDRSHSLTREDRPILAQSGEGD